MNESYDLESILNAIEDINTKPKDRSTTVKLNIIKKNKGQISQSEVLLPITEQLILEAEEHSGKIKNNRSAPLALNEEILILDKEYDEQNLSIISLEEFKHDIIKDIHSLPANKVEEKTLKIIIDLRHKINNLENEIKTLNEKKEHEDYNSNNNTKLSDNKEHLINEDYVEQNEKDLTNDESNSLSVDVINTLRMQESLIKNLEINEEKLRLNTIDLEQDITLFNNVKINDNKNLSEDSNQKFVNKINKQFKKSDQSDSKVGREIIFYKENYERLIIENNDVRKKLVNTKKQITSFEQNIKELEDAFENLNNILSKNSIIKLDQRVVKNPTESESSTKRSQKLILSSTQIFDKNND